MLSFASVRMLRNWWRRLGYSNMLWSSALLLNVSPASFAVRSNASSWTRIPCSPGRSGQAHDGVAIASEPTQGDLRDLPPGTHAAEKSRTLNAG